MLGGSDDEEAGHRVEVPGSTALHRGSVGGEDLGAPWVVGREALGVRFEERAPSRRLAHAPMTTVHGRTVHAVTIPAAT